MTKPWISFVNKTHNLDDVVEYIDRLNDGLKTHQISAEVVASKMRELVDQMDVAWEEEWGRNPELLALFNKFKDVKSLAQSISRADKAYPKRRPMQEKYVSTQVLVEQAELTRYQRAFKLIECLKKHGIDEWEGWEKSVEDVRCDDENYGPADSNQSDKL